PITLSVDRAGQSFDTSVFARMPSGRGSALTYTPLPNGQLPAGEVAILFLQFSYNGILPAPKFRCPPGITAAIQTDDALLQGAGIGAAFHIHTSAPVAAYDIFPYGGGNSATTSATLLYPTSAWGTNYVGVTAWPVQDTEDFLQFVAVQDDTTVTIQP